MSKTIGEILFDYEEARKDLKLCAEEVTKKAIELGQDEKVAQDTRAAVSYLHGYTRSKKR